MIESLEIQNFGSYKDFVWKNEVRDMGNNVVKFKRLNILYGRNYSGKTTLSRIIRSLETKVMPQGIPNPSFSIVASGTTIKDSQLNQSAHVVRVYNKDFVDENLSFLRGADGKISPFAILGEANAEIKTEIQNLEQQLGSVETKTGFRYDYQQKKNKRNEVLDQAKRLRNDIEQLFTDKANKPPYGMKHNPLLKDPNYDSKKLKLDIKNLKRATLAEAILSEQALADTVTALQETALPAIPPLKGFSGNLQKIFDEVSIILAAKIAPTSAIQDLLNNALLQSWAKTGIGLHRNLRSTCGFCGNPIPEELWTRLGDHFSQESKDLQGKIDSARAKILTEQSRLKQFFQFEDITLYNVHKIEFEQRLKSIKVETELYDSALTTLLIALQEREQDIYNIKPTPAIHNNVHYINQSVGLVNEVIQKNNHKTKSLETDQNAARSRLRLSTVASFIREISLDEKEKQLTELDDTAKKMDTALIALEAEGMGKVQRIKELEAMLRDEKKGAAKVNAYLTQFFGHNTIRLEAIETRHDSRSYEFQILRGDSLAYNLSEGECSLLAFCYFIAKLDDTESIDKEKIIYIDDPISSLDSNHIFFIYSLIESVLARPRQGKDGNTIKDEEGKPTYAYKQLFISTHNLEFLKYLKRLSKPPKNHESFLITSGSGQSKITVMPDYLRKYITELNYLFAEILTCADHANAAGKYHCFYNFGNNLRKFLEAYLFFKYPFALDESRDYDARIRKFFCSGSIEEALIQRLTNEFSHLGETIDRSAVPLDCAEISKVAAFILGGIKRNDPDQYNHFISSVDGVDPLNN